VSRLLPRRSFLASPLLVACSKKRVAELPVLGALPELPLTDQEGQERRLQDYRGKLLLVAFFFTRCPSVCPRLIARMQEMERALAQGSRPFHLAAISVDPEHDTPEVLRGYASARGIRAESFSLLTGDHSQIARAAEENFKIGLEGSYDPDKPGLGITHGSHVILVDRESRIRAFVRTFDDDAVRALLGYVEALESPS
jgi:protein SCO1/2